MAAVLNSNRLSLRLARCRTSVQSQRTLTRIPLVNLRQKFQVPYKKPAGGVTLSFNRHFHNMAVDELKAILSEEVPLFTGVIPLHANNSQLFYRNAADGSLAIHPLIYSFFIILVTFFVS
jgi:hypothetical protein